MFIYDDGEKHLGFEMKTKKFIKLIINLKYLKARYGISLMIFLQEGGLCPIFVIFSMQGQHLCLGPLSKKAKVKCLDKSFIHLFKTSKFNVHVNKKININKHINMCLVTAISN